MKPSTSYLSNKQHKKCRMCKQPGTGKFYEFISLWSKILITPVCRTCMMREYYGARGKRSKYWTNDDIFGIKDHK